MNKTDVVLAVELLEDAVGIHSYTGKQLYRFTLILQSLLRPIAAIGKAQMAHARECGME